MGTPKQDKLNKLVYIGPDTDLKVISGLGTDKMKLTIPKDSKKPKAGYVYAIRIDDYIKIGCTFSLDQRLHKYATFPPFSFEVLLTDYVLDKRMVERTWQVTFKDRQVKGEWFYVGDVEDAHKLVVESYLEVKKNLGC